MDCLGGGNRPLLGRSERYPLDLACQVGRLEVRKQREESKVERHGHDDPESDPIPVVRFEGVVRGIGVRMVRAGPVH